MQTTSNKNGLRPAPIRARIPVAALIRMFVVGTIAIGAASYAIYRHYFQPKPSMLAPRPDSSEVPIEIEPEAPPSAKDGR